MDARAIPEMIDVYEFAANRAYPEIKVSFREFAEYLYKRPNIHFVFSVIVLDTSRKSLPEKEFVNERAEVRETAAAVGVWPLLKEMYKHYGKTMDGPTDQDIGELD